MQRVNKTYVLFVSKKCPKCTYLLQLLAEHKLLEQFKIIIVDNNPNVPRTLKGVPAIITPQITKILYGRETLNWIRLNSQFGLTTNSVINFNKELNPLLDEIVNNTVNNFGFNKLEIIQKSDAYTTIHDENILNSNNTGKFT